jgi:ATP-dependent Clp protease adaptor protein ClpS
MIPGNVDSPEAMTRTLAPPEVEKEKLDELATLFNVVLLDDDEHTYEYVIDMLQKLFLMSEVDAFRRAVEVDTVGRTVVITCGLGEAEFGRDQIHAFGPDWRMPQCKGSMRAVVEPAGSGPQLRDN